MSAEWMVDVPPDLARNWLVAARPAGKRCVVTATGGTTRVHWRSGRPRAFPSALPNGSRVTRSGGQSSCKLDCIWSEQEQTYYVVDVISWKDHELVDCPAEFRLFWLASKLAETRAAEACSTNPCRFHPLRPVECSAEQLHSAYGGERPFGAERDGLLFWHREGLYEAGSSPLLLAWSDGATSSRFYNYGSAGMAQAVAHCPDKAERWRTAEVEAAVVYADLLACVEQPEMDLVDSAPPPPPVVAPLPCRPSAVMPSPIPDPMVMGMGMGTAPPPSASEHEMMD